VRWDSDGGGEFSVEPAERAASGTDVTLHLRDGENDLLDGYRLKSIIGKYSDHIAVPIMMRKETWDKDQGAMVSGDEVETVNQASALWTRPKSEISDEQYQAFYRHVSHDFGEPLAWSHSRVEGRTEYTQLLYIPAHAPFDLWDRNQRHGIKLYVRRVFIMDDAEQLLPPYLRFVRGVIDSSDLPLNVSREILQESRDVRAIREGSTKRVLALLEELAEKESGKYTTFWSEFGQVLKEGIGEDAANRERIAALLRFVTTAADGASVSLQDYVGRMKEGQRSIYYVTADTLDAASSSPHLEIFRKKGIEVLLLADRVDEWMLSFLTEFGGKPLASVAKGGLDLDAFNDAAEKAAQDESAAGIKDLLAAVKAALGDEVKDVRASFRLIDSAACLVSDEQDISGHLQRLLKAAGQKAPTAKPILELNPQHPLVSRLRPDDAQMADWARLLLDQALLAEGGALDEPAAFVQRVNRLLLGVGPQ
jgi:molecular chaperone HtpG